MKWKYILREHEFHSNLFNKWLIWTCHKYYITIWFDFFLIPKGLLCLCQIKTLEVIMEYKHEDKMIILHQITFIWQTRLSNLEWSIDCFVPKMYIIHHRTRTNETTAFLIFAEKNCNTKFRRLGQTLSACVCCEWIWEYRQFRFQEK